MFRLYILAQGHSMIHHLSFHRNTEGKRESFAMNSFFLVFIGLNSYQGYCCTQSMKSRVELLPNVRHVLPGASVIPHHCSPHHLLMACCT